MKFRRRPDGKFDRLREVPQLASLSDDDIERLASLADLIEVPEGSELTHEERRGRSAFLILTGEAEVTAHGEEVARIGPGEFVGELAVLTGTPRSATVTTTAAAWLLVFDTNTFTEMLNTSRDLSHHLLGQLAGRLSASSAS